MRITLIWILALCLSLIACGEGEDLPVADSMLYPCPDAGQLMPDASAPDATDDSIVPINALWSAHVLSTTCVNIPQLTRIQFSTRHTVFMVFSSAYSDETEWTELDPHTLLTGERPLGLTSPDTTIPMLESAVWDLNADHTWATATVRYAYVKGRVIVQELCQSEMLITLETP